MWTENNEQRIEILTNKVIKMELRKLCKSKVILTITKTLVFICFLFVLFFYFKLTCKPIITYIVFGVSLVILCTILIYDIVSLTKMIINKNNFTVVKEKLISTEDKSFSPLYGKIRPIFYLKFSGYDRYGIPDENYKWSKLFYMNHNGVLNSSTLGDEFYLVIVDNKIQLVYNCKMFAYTH